MPTREQGSGGEGLERGKKPLIIVSVSPKLCFGNEGDSLRVGCIALFLNVIMEGNYRDTMVEQEGE